MNSDSIAEVLYEFVHDLRAPIRAIGGFGQALREDASAHLPSKLQTYLGRICDNAHRLHQQADWLSRLARALQPPKSRQNVFFGSLAAELSHQLRPHGSQLRVELDLAAAQATGWDPDHLRLLIESVYRYAELQLQGSENPVLQLAWRLEEGYSNVLASLHSSGTRVPDANPPPYSPRLEIAVLHILLHHYPGAGVLQHENNELQIGLGVIQSAATVAPNLPPNSLLPDAHSPQTGTPNCDATPPFTALRADVVLVDDDPLDAELFKIVLQDTGVTARLAWFQDPRQALQTLANTSDRAGSRLCPVVVFVDLKMPTMSGVEFIYAVRTALQLRFLPIVVLSSSAQPEEVRAAYDAGAHAFVLKSTDFESFADSIRAAATFWWRHNQLPRD